MATPNYGFEKRQKELAKKRKKEDKLKAKSDRKSGLLPEDGSEADETDGEQASETTADAAEVSMNQSDQSRYRCQCYSRKANPTLRARASQCCD